MVPVFVRSVNAEPLAPSPVSSASENPGMDEFWVVTTRDFVLRKGENALWIT